MTSNCIRVYKRTLLTIDQIVYGLRHLTIGLDHPRGLIGTPITTIRIINSIVLYRGVILTTGIRLNVFSTITISTSRNTSVFYLVLMTQSVIVTRDCIARRTIPIKGCSKFSNSTRISSFGVNAYLINRSRGNCLLT